MIRMMVDNNMKKMEIVFFNTPFEAVCICKASWQEKCHSCETRVQYNNTCSCNTCICKNQMEQVQVYLR